MSFLQALNRAYDRLSEEGKVPPFGYSSEKISFCISLNPDGTIDAIYAKNVESTIERVIATNMGNDLSKNSTDENDKGVKVFVNPSQNISQTSKLEISVNVRPYGTNRWIDILLGFDLTT